MNNIAFDLVSAFNDGYRQGKADAEEYMLHCGDTDEPITNADRIRSMSDEELAEWLAHLTDCVNCPCRDPYDQCDTVDGSCKKQWLEWLKEEAEG